MEDNALLDTGFIGSGWSFLPGVGISVDGRGSIALTRGDQDIAKSIYLILSTAPGERVMRTEFGCGIHNLVFSVANAQTFGEINYQVRRALARWEPRIDVTEVRADVDQDVGERILVDITYKVRETNNERNLVYPFYFIPRGQD